MEILNWFCRKRKKIKPGKTKKQGDAMDIVKMIGDLFATVSALQAQMGELNDQLANAEAELEKVAKGNYEKGFEEGKASVVCDVTKVYSEDEVVEKLKNAVEPLKEELELVKKQMENLGQEIEVKLNLARQEAVVGFKEQLRVKIEELLSL